MFATGPRAVGFTIVWPEGVIFSSMMTYHAQFLLLVVAGWVNRQQQDVIDYLQEENRVLRAGLRGKRLKLSDDDRRRLAVKAQALGREALAQIASVATSATLLRWYRRRTCISSKASEWLARVVLGLSITAFAATSAGEDLFSGFDDGWRKPWMERVLARRSNTFRLETEAENRFLRVDSRNSASALWRRVDVTGELILSWRWRVSTSLGHIDDVRRRRSDDYAARVAVMFDGTPFARTTPLLMYVWAGNESVGNVYPSPYSDQAATIVLRSGDVDSGEWFMEERDVSADFERYFGRPAERVTGVVLMVDTDNTDSQATAWFDELVLHRDAEP